MSEREKIFARIREALNVEAHAYHGTGLPTTTEHRRVMPSASTTAEGHFARFARNAADLRATFKLVRDASELTTELRLLSDAEKWRRVATHRSLLAQVQTGMLALPTILTDEGYDKQELCRPLRSG
jgi:hypothetical protein